MFVFMVNREVFILKCAELENYNISNYSKTSFSGHSELRTPTLYRTVRYVPSASSLYTILKKAPIIGHLLTLNSGHFVDGNDGPNEPSYNRKATSITILAWLPLHDFHFSLATFLHFCEVQHVVVVKAIL